MVGPLLILTIAQGFLVLCRAGANAMTHARGLPSPFPPLTRGEAHGPTYWKTLNQQPQSGPGDMHEWKASRPTRPRDPWSRLVPELAADERELKKFGRSPNTCDQVLKQPAHKTSHCSLLYREKWTNHPTRLSRGRDRIISWGSS
jgi:hypothetical protein